jgi:hypothetical protein
VIIVNSNASAQEKATTDSSKWWVFDSVNKDLLHHIRQNDATDLESQTLTL